VAAIIPSIIHFDLGVTATVEQMQNYSEGGGIYFEGMP
jgi:hypothetical protein